MPNRFYITTPIYYVNDVPHLGTAYTTVIADVLSRFHRMVGHDTRFLTGTDEHGQKIERAASEKGVPPKQFVDEMSYRFRKAWPTLLCDPDDFIRTTEPRHKELAIDLWRRCEQAGDIYESNYEGLYCEGCEAFYTEKDLLPSPDGMLCPQHQRPVKQVRESSFFFRLSKYQDRLLQFYAQHPLFIEPESRRNEVLSFVKSGITDLSVSRTTIEWGIPVPTQSDKPHVMYVWFDALANYLTALGPEGSELRKYWPPQVHLVGKDILRQHAIYWPAFLMSAGFSDDQLPQKIFAHGWLTINGQKMSKSLRNVVEPLKLAEVFGAELVRFYLAREIAFGQDGDFSHKQLIARYNAELADTIGNLLHRTLGLVGKLRKDSALTFGGGVTPLETALAEAAATQLAAYRSAFETFAPHRAVESMLALGRAANKYIDESAPWSEAKKENTSRVDVILASALEIVRWLSVMLWPVMPHASTALRAQLGLAPISPSIGADALALKWAPITDTRGVVFGEPVFPKIDADREKAMLDELGVNALEAPAEPPQKKAQKLASKPSIEPASEIAIEDFFKLDLRIATVLAAERVKKSDKLLRLEVDVGEATPRQIVAGIGKAMEPESLVGKQVVVVANLKPVSLKGVESRGMILAASESEADIALLAPTIARKPGTRVK